MIYKFIPTFGKLTRVDKSDLQVYPYFWQTYGPKARYQAKSRDKSLLSTCVGSKLALFPYFLYMQLIPTSF